MVAVSAKAQCTSGLSADLLSSTLWPTPQTCTFVSRYSQLPRQVMRLRSLTTLSARWGACRTAFGESNFIWVKIPRDPLPFGLHSLLTMISTRRKKNFRSYVELRMKCAHKLSRAGRNVGHTSKSRPSDRHWHCTMTCLSRPNIWQNVNPRSPNRPVSVARCRQPIMPFSIFWPLTVQNVSRL